MLRAPGELPVMLRGVSAGAREMSVEVVPFVSEEIGQRRFKWRLRAPGETEVLSHESFATKREAAAQGEIALQRAFQRGRIGR
jgi:hypothetical protein